MDYPKGCFSPSNMDTYRDYSLGREFPWGELDTEGFTRRMLRLDPPSAKMEAGTAVHKAIELAAAGRQLNVEDVDGWSIDFQCDATLALPDTREKRITKSFEGIQINGRVDAIGDGVIHDIKTTGKIDFQKYLDSYQWRVYLWMTGLDRFVYDVFQVKVKEAEKSVVVQGYQRLTVTRYPALDEDVERAYRGFKSLIDEMLANGLLSQEREAAQ